MIKTFRDLFSLEMIVAIVVLASSFLWLTTMNDNSMQPGSRSDLTPSGISQPLEPDFVKTESVETPASNQETLPSVSPLPAESSVQPTDPPYCVDNSATSTCKEVQCFRQYQLCPPPLSD